MTLTPDDFWFFSPVRGQRASYLERMCSVTSQLYPQLLSASFLPSFPQQAQSLRKHPYHCLAWQWLLLCPTHHSLPFFFPVWLKRSSGKNFRAFKSFQNMIIHQIPWLPVFRFLGTLDSHFPAIRKWTQKWSQDKTDSKMKVFKIFYYIYLFIIWYVHTHRCVDGMYMPWLRYEKVRR